MNYTTEKLIIDILAHEMTLTSSGATANIFTASQNFKMPNTDGLFVIVQCVDAVIMSNRNTPQVVSAVFSETQNIVLSENVQIDLLSRNIDARTRRWEVLAALYSTYSQQVQEANNFRIFRHPTSFANTTEAEGGSYLNRFTTVFSCHVWYNKQQAIEYYKSFPTEVINEDGTHSNFTLST